MDYCYTLFYYFISGVFISDDGNDVCISLSVYVPSEACSMELCFKVSVSGDLCGYRAYLSYLIDSETTI